MRLRNILLASAIMCAACAPLPREITLSNSFNYNDFSWADKEGDNVISGTALLRTVGGDVKTCGGLQVNLLPDAPYSRERMLIFYRYADGGFYSIQDAGPGIIFMNEPHEYSRVGRTSVCDSQGNFRFDNVPNGSYFVIAEVTWGSPLGGYLSSQGGRIMKRVEVNGGDSINLVMTRE